MWRTRHPILLLVIAGVTVHACVLTAVWWRTGSIDGNAFKSLDCGEYYAIAKNVAAHGTFSLSESPPLDPDTWRTPGYPLVLAAFLLLFGSSAAMLVVVQQVISLANALLLFAIARSLMSERRAMVVAILFLLEPFHLFYSTWLLATTVFTTALLMTWYAWQRATRSISRPWYATAGALAGVCILVRPVGMLLPLVLIGGGVITYWLKRRESSQALARRAGAAALIVAVSASIVVGSWIMRNGIATGHYALSDQGGVVLAYFKATEVILWHEGRTIDRYEETSLDPARIDDPHLVWESIDKELRARLDGLNEADLATLTWHNLAQGNKTSADSFAVSDALWRIGWSRLMDQPLSTAACYLARCGAILTFPLNLAITPPTGVTTNRLRSAAIGSVYLLLVVCAIIRWVRRGLTFEQIYFPLACTAALLVTTAPQIDPRFRVPMIPMLLVLCFVSPATTRSSSQDS
ncbi:MAG: glycosyltransferase family 39 protein [Planctomycetes bacterium]|nr:glycosyltransferase family 39 protein [Planctomycetota bacterium]